MINGEPIVLGGSGETASIFVTGLQSTDTVTASKDGRTWNGVWGSYTKPNPVSHNLPIGYTEYEWMQSTVGAYLDTGIKCASTVDVEITATAVSYTVGQDSGIFGGYDAWNNKMYSIHLGSNPMKFEYLYHRYIGAAQNADNSQHNFKIQNGVLYIDGTQKLTSSYSFASTTSNIFLFGFGTAANGEIKIQSGAKFTDRAISQTYTFIPCKSASNVAGMYVLETETFIAGVGTFTFGDEVPRYISTNGHLISKLNSYGQYSVVATDGSRTSTKTVLVDMATEYDVEMSIIRRLYLYNEGDECEDVTSGWTSPDVVHQSSYPSPYGGSYIANFQDNYGSTGNVTRTKNDDNLYMLSNSVSNCSAISSFHTSNAIDLSDYNTLHIEYVKNAIGNYGLTKVGGLTELYEVGQSVSKQNQISDGSISFYLDISETRTELSADISDVSSSLYIFVDAEAYAGSAISTNLTVYKVWLE